MASSVFRQALLPSPPVPLPCVPGPKLAPCTPGAHADIEFVEFLGRENDVDSIVWKVKINRSGPFALKVFYFCHWDFLRKNQGGDLERSLANPQLKLTWPRGWKMATISGTGTSSTADYPSGLSSRTKDPEPAQAPRMWADLQALHSLGIFVKDTQSGNYLDGKLVDFSRSWTMYHPSLDQIGARQLRSLMLDELQQLLDYYYELANGSAGPKVIPQDLDAFCSGHLDRYKNFPKAYNWLKWAKDADAAKEYVEQRLFGSATQ